MERGIEMGKAECVALRGQLARLDALAREQELIRHFSERKTQREHWSRQNCGPVQRIGESGRELSVGNGIWRHDVHGPRKFFVREHRAYNGDGICQSDPRNPLLAAPKPPT